MKINAGLAQYQAQNGKKHYLGDSYSVNVANFIDNRAKIKGNDTRGNIVNKNISAEVIYSFENQIPLLVWLLGGVTVLAVGVTVWALFLRSPIILTPDYAPVDEEVNAEVIPNETPSEKAEKPSGGGGSLSMIYSDSVTINLSDNTAVLFFGNPSQSTHNVLVQIVIQDTVVAQSGTMKPGTQVKKLDLLSGAAKSLAAGGYDGLLRIIPYDPDTGEKSILTNDIKVKITVK